MSGKFKEIHLRYIIKQIVCKNDIFLVDKQIFSFSLLCQIVSIANLKFELYCQAQPQLQVKLSLKAELALLSINPAPTHQLTPHPHHPSPPIEDNLNV